LIKTLQDVEHPKDTDEAQCLRRGPGFYPFNCSLGYTGLLG
jgi:hypothetical protein